MELLKELQDKRELLDSALTVSKQRGIELANAEKSYQVANAKFIAEQRVIGTPATLILPLAKGDEKVSQLRLERDIAKTLYENAKEAINVYKIGCRLIEEQISREWGASK